MEFADIVDVGPAVTNHQVDLLEHRLGMKIPDAYRSFLLKYNGGRLLRHKFMSHIAEHCGVLSAFFGLEGAAVSIEHQRTLLLDAIPSSFLAIAEDPYGNRYCIDCSSSGDEGIWYWIHEAEEDDDGRIVCEMHQVADSFHEFLNQIVRIL